MLIHKQKNGSQYYGEKLHKINKGQWLQTIMGQKWA